MQTENVTTLLPPAARPYSGQPYSGVPHAARPYAGLGQDGAEYTFGDFTLHPARKLLVRGRTPVALGGRAFDLLVALVERAGDVVGHHDLVAAVWPRAVVEENGLRVHMSALRKALGETSADQYVLTVAGRGYRFVKPVRTRGAAPWPAPPRVRPGPAAGHLVGREAALARLDGCLARGLLVTITGAGGCGKSALAQAYAAAHAERFPDGCHVFDCAGGDDLEAAGAALCGRAALLVLDNCEQAPAAAAALAGRCAGPGSRLALLATSRAPLGVAGERVFRLAPLDLPAVNDRLDCRQALAAPAVALFVERAAANSSRFALTPANLPCVLALCRELDGLPLALELAAARVEALGVEGLAARLDDMLRLLTRGRRLAGARHASLEAMLACSEHLLGEPERVVLRRLALFDGAFAPAAALRACAFGALAPADVERALAALAACSLLEEEGRPQAPRWRLLRTTRRYALARLAASGEAELLARRMEHDVPE